jgi:autotransporter-associated beta strand protein
MGCGWMAIVWLAIGGVALANVPGGGSSGANVALSYNSTVATLSNGIVSATITIANAEIPSLTYNGFQTVQSSGDQVYFSMDGGTTFEVPHNCVMSVVANTTDMVDLAFTQTYVSGNTSYIHPEDIQIHYVLRRGNTGLYVYAILSHPASYPALSMDEWRMVWWHPHTSTLFTFEKEYVDNFRHHDMPTYAEFSNPVITIPASGNTAAQSTRIAEISLMPPAGTLPADETSTRAGDFNCKYEFNMEYNTFGAWGHASDVNKKGVWFIPGSFEFFNDGPTHQDLSIAESYSLIHFGRDHYNGSSTAVAAGTAWSKIYGPYLMYCNSGSSADACWADAQAQAQAEQAAWPYSWLTSNSTIYPSASGRGTVTGQFVVTDPLKPAVSGAGAWVGLATPDTSSTYTSLYGNYDWQFDSNNYEYWAKADANGNFNIPNVRPGTYTLYAFTYGAMGQYSQANVTVSAGQTTALGQVDWNVTHSGNWIAWEIGVPDRKASEFNNGATTYYVPYAWTNFSNQFTNPLNYNVGSSNWATDWNYAHDFWQVGGNDSSVGTLSLWPWNINFNLASVPSSGNATLNIAVAGNYYGHIRVWVNRATTSNPNLDDDSPPAGGGDALLREGVHATYGVIVFSFPVSDLHAGSNTITLEQINGTLGEANHFMYDYLDLEMPGSPPTAQPAVGRAFTWVGSQGNNSWDVGTFINWAGTGGNATFNQGDVVTFDDTGNASSAIVLNGALAPNGLTVNATQNYTFGGSGSITGTTGLMKMGSGTLTLTNTGTNNFSGNTVVSAGTLQINNMLSNSANVTVQGNATLGVAGNLTTGMVTINAGGTLIGGAGGRVNAALINNGAVDLAAGGTFTFNGAVTNNGTMRLTGGTSLAANGAFINNGVLDLMTGAQTLPANFTNHGVVLDLSVVKVSTVSVSNGAVQINLQSYAGHNYQLQWSATLSPPVWQNLGSAQAGTGGMLTFTDSSALTAGLGFYRVVVAP